MNNKHEDDINYLIKGLGDQTQNNQILTRFDDKMGKIKRENYFPNEDGSIIFKNQTSWSETGYSVYEMTELLKKYRDKIHYVQFEAYDGSVQDLVNLYESDAYSNNGEYSCVLVIGDGNKVIEQIGKVNNKVYIDGMLFPQLHKGFNY